MTVRVPTIACINATTKTTDAEIAHVTAALNTQVHRDFAPIHGKTANLVAVAKGHKPLPGSWWLTFSDTSDESGALGYHDLTNEDLPIGKVFVETTKQDGGLWSVTASHEVLEMLADPAINRVASIENGQQDLLFAWEVCDACEADDLGYLIGDVRVSDFVTEAWFDVSGKPDLHGGKIYDFMGHIKKPFQLLPGGYIGVRDLHKADGWTQITDRLSSGGKIAYRDRAKVGSRRERRRTPRHHWHASTAHTDPSDPSSP